MKIKELLQEAALTPGELVKHGGMYLTNMLDKIANGGEFPVVGKYQSTYGKTVHIDPNQIEHLKQLFYPEGNPQKAKISAGGNLVTPHIIKNIRIKTSAGQPITTGALEKTADIKGKAVDYNIGDIGEFAIAISVYTRFIKKGKQVTLTDVMSQIKKVNVAYSQKGGSGMAEINNSIAWPKGKVDEVFLNAVLPRRSMDYITQKIKETGEIKEKVVHATFGAAIAYANQNKKVDVGIQQISKNPNANVVKINCDGVSDQKGTKADVIMDIDGVPINIVSAKVGRSQLGQASGHVFDKQVVFFKTVFGENVAAYEKKWGETLEEHDAVLSAIWSKINPKIMKAFKGDNTQKEMPIVKQVADGLIKYSNTAKAGDVDIVKLVATPGSPSYKLLRVDERLYEALQKADLFAIPGEKGIAIYGYYNGKKILLMKARSYLSKAAKTVRTIVEGGDLLDILAEVVDEK